MQGRLFGTDGYRGPVDNSRFPGVNANTFERLSIEYVKLMAEKSETAPVVIVGGDTRESGEELREAVCVGVAKAAAEVWDVGIVPTPVIAWLAQRHNVGAIAVTASHNPWTDNGFKPFDLGGRKLSIETVDMLERQFFAFGIQAAKTSSQSGKRYTRNDLMGQYIEHVASSLGGSEVLAQRIVLVDGANGAAYEAAPLLYKALGATVVEFACSNNGRYINAGCGATNLNGVIDFIHGNPELATSSKFLGAFATDGDADRVMGVDVQARTLDGNDWMGQLAIGQKGIVGTLYTNSGLRRALGKMGVEFHECPNGDIYVTSKLLELSEERGRGFTRGGEFTGHLIDLDHLTSGDGLFMGGWLAVRAAIGEASLVDIKDSLSLWPERMASVKVTKGRTAQNIIGDERVQEAIADAKASFGQNGRVVIRGSGTEPLIRIWAEATDREKLDAAIDKLTGILRSV